MEGDLSPLITVARSGQDSTAGGGDHRCDDGTRFGSDATFAGDESCQPMGWASATMIPSGPRT